MNHSLKFLLIAALFGGALVACSKPESPSTKAAPPAAPALPDLAKPETWDRKDRPFAAKGRVRIDMEKFPGVGETEARCVSGPTCRCLGYYRLGAKGPRPTDWSWLQDSGGDIGAVNGCTGEGKYPQGEAEVEGTLKEGVFVLSKPPKYLNAPPTPAPTGSAP